jgi:hypothetical protein
MSYNRGALQSLLNNRNGKPVVAKLQTDRQSSQDYARTVAKVRAEGGDVSLLPLPLYVPQKCHTIPREQSPDLFDFLKTQENIGNSGNWGNEWPEDETESGLPELPLIGNLNTKKVTEVTSSPQMDMQQNPSYLEKVTSDPKLPKQVTSETLDYTAVQPKKSASYQVTFSGSPKSFLQKTPILTGTPIYLEKGDMVVINATSRRWRKGSSPLPSKLSLKLKTAESALLVEIEACDAELFRQLSQPLEFLKLNSEGDKAQLLTPDGRKHAFDLADVRLLKKAEVEAHADG